MLTATRCPGQHAPDEPRPGRPVWCIDTPRYDDLGRYVPGPPEHRGCTETITRDLAAIFDLALRLAPGRLNTPQDAKADNRGMGSSTLVHAPTNSPSWDDADELIRWAVTLEDTTRARLGEPPLKTQTRMLWPTMRWLNGHATALLADPDTAEDVGRQIMARKRSLEVAVGMTRLVHRLPGICPVCERKGLRRADGDDVVRCPGCGASWDWGYYELLAAAATQDLKASPGKDRDDEQVSA